MQTPLQYLLLVGNSVYTVDFAGTLRLLTMSPSRELAESVITSLANYHQVQAKVSNMDEIDGITLEELAGEAPESLAEEHEHDEWSTSEHSLEHQGETLRIAVRTCTVTDCSASQFQDNEGIWRNQP